MIKDLEHINNHRSMVNAIENFKQIMSRPAPENNDDQTKYANPLVPGTALKGQQKFIAANMTIFAQFETAINNAIQHLNESRARK